MAASPRGTKKCVLSFFLILSISFFVVVSSYLRLSFFQLPIELPKPQIASNTTKENYTRTNEQNPSYTLTGVSGNSTFFRPRPAATPPPVALPVARPKPPALPVKPKPPALPVKPKPPALPVKPASLVISDDMPSIRGTNITANEIIQNLDRCRKSTIASNKKCAQVHANPTNFWRSTRLSGFSQKEDANRINMASACCAFNHPELMAGSVSDELFPWERDYLSQGPLTNLLDTAYASRSVVEFLEKPGKTFYVGDDVSFRIRIFTGRGEKRGKGGDSVRLWLVNHDLGAAVTANVKDEKDGTYTAKSKLPWVGKVVVKATIAHTRELFRSVLYIQRLFTTSHSFFGVFKNKVASEAAPCSPVPFLPGFQGSQICNMTKYNGNVPWYCGKPVKQELNCSDLAGITKHDSPSNCPLTSAEAQLVKLTESKRPFLIPINITLEVKAKPNSNLTTIPKPPMPCWKRDLTATFKEDMSTGYFYKKMWHPFSCVLPKVTKQFTDGCLKNTIFKLIGDSNTRAQFDRLASLTKCKDKIIRTKVRWHAPLRCDIDSIGMSIQLYPHKMPFYGSRGELVTQRMLTSFVTLADSIPSTGRHVVLVHYFLHFIPFHLSIAKSRMLDNRAAIARALERNPTSYFIIQGPHSAYDHSNLNKHKMNVFLFYMTRSIMSGLGDRVMFLNTFDLTVANQNAAGHPEIADQFMNLYLGHICERRSN